MFVFFFMQQTTCEMRIGDWSSAVCSSDLGTWPLRRTRRYASRCSREEQAVSVALKWPRSCLMIAIFIDERGRSVQPKGPQRRDRHRHLISKAACHLNSARGLRLERTSRSDEHTSELQSLMRTSYPFLCLKK